MLLALEHFVSMYGSKINSHSKLFLNRSFNQHNWEEVKTTSKLHEIICQEHEHRNGHRIIGSCLKLRVALGYATKNTIANKLDGYFENEEEIKEMTYQSPQT